MPYSSGNRDPTTATRRASPSDPRSRSASGRSGIAESASGYWPSPGRMVRADFMKRGHIPAG